MSKPKGLLCGHLNIQREAISKCDQIGQLVTESNIDVLGLSETNLKDSSPTAAVTVRGYNIFRQDRIDQQGGGVLVYVKNHIKCTRLPVPNEIDLECVCLNIFLSPQMSFVLINIYRPPLSKVVWYDKFAALLTHFADGNNEIIVNGDVNVNWNKS